MAREIRPVPFEEFSNNIASFFERVIHGHETVMVEKDEGELVVVQPARLAKSAKPERATSTTRRKRTAADREADREAFLSSLGGWKDLVDTDKLIKDIYESRRISTRPPVQL